MAERKCTCGTGDETLHALDCMLNPLVKIAYTISWDRIGLVSEYDFVNRYSRQHIYEEDANHTLCGARIRWPYVGPGDGTRCKRCHAIAAKRLYVSEYGDAIQ